MNRHSIPPLCAPTVPSSADPHSPAKGGFLSAVLSALRPVALLAIAATSLAHIHAADLSGAYEFNPVRIGAGGCVTGFVSHPLDANVRYCRTDVGNAYRWDTTLNEWVPMIVRNADGTGLPADVAAVSARTGCSSIAIDPNNVNVILMAFPVFRSSDFGTTYPSLGENVYRSTDGGRNFVKGNLSVPGSPNKGFWFNGERLKVDPNNSNIVYFCTYSSGLYRSLDAGSTWAQVTGSGAPLASSTLINIHYYKNGGTTNAFGQTVSSVLYAVGGKTDAFRSADGGQSWTNITNGTTLSSHTINSTLDQNGVLWIPQSGGNKLWKYNGTWTSYNVSTSSSLGTVQSVAVDPANANRIFSLSNGCCVSRSVNGGANWTVLGSLKYANTFGWLPQMIAWRTSGGIYFDANGELWLPQGNEGILRYMPTVSNTETSIYWTIQSQGIEEMVAQDIIIPKGSGDKVITASEDTTGHYITDPDQFTAKQCNVQTSQLISCANGVSVCPNATNYAVIFNTDCFVTRNPLSGYSNDGGNNWTQFTSNTNTLQAGSIAVSRRNGWGLGSDHIVMLPSSNSTSANLGRPPYYSKDGGATWTATTSFALDTYGQLSDKRGYWNCALKQRQLKADPFVADKFYLNFVDGGSAGSFYISTDGGVTWTLVSSSGLPRYAHAGNLEVNYNLQDDLWFADGSEGTGTNASTHGLFHSAPGSNNKFTKVTGIDYAYSLALGAGRGQAGDAAYSVYFYGKLTGDAAWGVFRSVNAGTSWDRVSYYPAGLIDQVTCMAASWDTFGVVYLGFMGNSYVYGKPLLPNPPSAPAATAVSTSQINLTWSDASNNETGFKIERSLDQNSWTLVATTSTNATSYSNTGLTDGIVYFYRIRATNASGDSSNSVIVSATTPFAAPTALGATAVSGTQIDLTWTDNSDSETGYKVERSLDQSTWTIVTTTGSNAVSYSNVGLTATTTYYYRVRATNANGDSTNSNTTTATTPNVFGVFIQNFNSSTAIADYVGTGYNLFSTISQGTGGGYSISGSNELVITHGSDPVSHFLSATGGNLTASLQRGCIFKGTIRAVANPNSYTNKAAAYLQLGTSGTATAIEVYMKVSGTSTAPTVYLQTANVSTGSVGASAGTPFCVVLNRTGSGVTYTRPDGQSKTLGSGQYDLWFGADGNNGAVINKWIPYPSNVVDSFWFMIPGSQSSTGCAVAIDDIKIDTIDVGTTQF